MAYNLKEIIPGEGLGDLKFGMTRDEVQTILSVPNDKDSINDPEYPEDNSEVWHYDEFEISLGFEKIGDEWRLENIALSSNDYELHHRKLIGLDKETLLAKLDKMGLTEFLLDEFEEEEGTQTVIRSNETAINFFLEDGVLSEIMWSPIYEEE